MPQKTQAGSEAFWLKVCDWAAVLAAALFMFTTLAMVEHSRQYKEQAREAAEDHKPSQDSSGFHDAGGEIKIYKQRCFYGESVGECAGRLTQQHIGGLYQWLIALAFAQFVVGYITWRLLRAQTRLIARQAEIQRDQNIWTHRPRVIVRAAELVPDEESAQNPKTPVSVKFIVANTGSSEAEVFAIGFDVWRRPNSASEMSVEELLRDPAPNVKTLVGGYTVDTTIISDRVSWRELVEIFELRDQSHHIALAGAILYTDRTGVIRRTQIWRKLDLATMHFVPSRNPEYEYAD